MVIWDDELIVIGNDQGEVRIIDKKSLKELYT